MQVVTRAIILTSFFTLFLPPVLLAQEWIDFNMRYTSTVNGLPCYYSSSSELNGVDTYESQGKYGVHNLFDGDSATAWVEGADGPGRGEWVMFSVGQELPAVIMIRNGYQKSADLFKNNARIKNATISLHAGFHIEGQSTEIVDLFRLKNLLHGSAISFEDREGESLFYLEPFCEDNCRRVGEALKEFKDLYGQEVGAVGEARGSEDGGELYFSYFVKIEITEIYPGTQWDDLCISEVDIRGLHHCRVPVSEKISEVYQDDESGAVRFNTEIRDNLLMLDIRNLPEVRNLSAGQQMWVVLMDVSDNNEWAQINYQFASEGGRVEEYSTLWHVKSRSRIISRLLEKSTQMYGFTTENERILLQTDQGSLILSPVGELIYYK